MGKMKSYKELLRDPRWQRKRLEVLEHASWECAECSGSKQELHVHHYWYETGIAPWDYPDECYGVLCDSCHQQWHAEKLHCDKLLAGMQLGSLHQVHGLIAGHRLVSEYEDYEIDGHCDPLFVVALVRGFWPPSDFQKLLIDECLKRMAHCEEFVFSDVVESVVPDCSEYAHIYAWIEAVRREVQA